MYGPVDGIGVVDWSFAGVPAGTGAAKIVARMFWKSPCGSLSLIVILPVASSAVIPAMSPFFVFENASAPTMFVKKPTPGESTWNSRLIAYLKSLAFTGVPFEYLRPERSVSVYVFPSDEICGTPVASTATLANQVHRSLRVTSSTSRVRRRPGGLRVLRFPLDSYKDVHERARLDAQKLAASGTKVLRLLLLEHAVGVVTLGRVED